MDKEKLEELIKQTVVDNSRLEELMAKGLVGETKVEFLELLKESQLFLPVTYSENMFEGIENSKPGDIFQPKGQVGFDINYLTGKDGSKAVPLFTSDEMMEKAGLRSSANVMFMSDLAEMLKQSDRYSAVAINPFTEHDVVIPFEGFMNLFYEPTEEEKQAMEALNQILEVMKEHSVELDKDYAFMFRNDEDVMKEHAVDGVFIPPLPFNVSSNPEFGKDLKYTNIILMQESKRIFPIGPDADLDIVIAPGSEFELVEEPDEFTRVWKCGAQPFYDDDR
jgi:hypothetical protein